MVYNRHLWNNTQYFSIPKYRLFDYINGDFGCYTSICSYLYIVLYNPIYQWDSSYWCAISKSIIAIAIVYPTPPILLNHPIAPVLPFFAITVLLNSFVISMPTILPDISKKVGSPFMGFIAIGYLIGILYGDIIFSILSVILTGIKL